MRRFVVDPSLKGLDHITESSETRCSLKFLREVIYCLWTYKDQMPPFISIQTKEPNHIWEGLIMRSYSVCLQNHEEDVLGCILEGVHYPFHIKNIIALEY